LWLEDIEEIVHILVNAVENREETPDALGRDAKTKITLEIGDKLCDEVNDLPSIAKRSNEISIKVESGRLGKMVIPGAEAYLKVLTYGTMWRAHGITDKDKLWTYHKLNKIFSTRMLRRQSLARSVSGRPLSISLGVFFTLSIVVLFLPRPLTPLALGSVLIVSCLNLAWASLVVFGRNSQTTIVLRHSSERSAARQEKFWKILPAIISGLCGIGATLLGLYLKHKYWP